MRAARQAFLAGTLLTGLSMAIGGPSARAQGSSTPRSLGGYGATSGNSMAGMGVGSPIIPYAGNFSGFMPYRMGGEAASPSNRVGHLQWSPRGHRSAFPR